MVAEQSSELRSERKTSMYVMYDVMCTVWSEVRVARWLCGISPWMVSPQHLRYFGHDEGRPSGHSPPLTCETHMKHA